MIVVFNKKDGLDSYSFFSIYTKKHIGIDQLAVALIINLLAGILLFIASLNANLAQEKRTLTFDKLPNSFWFVIVLFILMLGYFIKKKWNFSLKRLKINK